MLHNAVSSRRYSGINVFTLWYAVVFRGFSSHALLTFWQTAALGGSVRRGERGVGIIYTRRFVSTSEHGRADADGFEAEGRFGGMDPHPRNPRDLAREHTPRPQCTCTGQTRT